MNKAISGLLIAVAVIHLLPLAGVLGADRLTSLYGIPFQEPNLLIMMRHRAVLFGLLGLFLMYAAFTLALLPLALVAGLVSTISFIWFAWLVGAYNAAIGRVVVADVIALFCLLIALVLYFLKARAHAPL